MTSGEYWPSTVVEAVTNALCHMKGEWKRPASALPIATFGGGEDKADAQHEYVTKLEVCGAILASAVRSTTQKAYWAQVAKDIEPGVWFEPSDYRQVARMRAAQKVVNQVRRVIKAGAVTFYAERVA